MKKTYFVTGISTDVGKTVVSAILTEALEADYWKPIQSGTDESCDKTTVSKLVSNRKTNYFSNSYAFKAPLSPDAAAALENVEIDLNKVIQPKTENHLVIEGAGGLLVPLNNHQTIVDLIPTHAEVVLVSRHYLGSINHTLLSIAYLKQLGFVPKLIFVGDENKATEKAIVAFGDVDVIGRVPILEKSIKKPSKKLQQILKKYWYDERDKCKTNR